MMMSPGSSVSPSDRTEMIFGMPWIMVAVLAFCRSSPFTQLFTVTFIGSPKSSFGMMYGPHRAGSVEGLTLINLLVSSLQVAGRYVVSAAIPENVIVGAAFRNVDPLVTDDDAKLHLVVIVVAAGVLGNVRFMAD